MRENQGDLHTSTSARFSSQTAGSPTDGGGITALYLTGQWTKHSRSAVHHDFLSMALLIVEAKHELPMVFGASGNTIGADWTRAKTWRGKSRRDNVENDQNRNCEQKPAHDRLNQDHHSAGSRSKLWRARCSGSALVSNKAHPTSQAHTGYNQGLTSRHANQRFLHNQNNTRSILTKII